jgi:ribosomal protein S18 acetylase RimI-like enzyme
MPVVRRATGADAPELALLAERTFRATFGDANSAADMELHCRTHYGTDLQRDEIEDPGRTTFVAEDSGALVGFAQLRWDSVPAGLAGRRCVEIQRLYVTGSWHGRGLGARLMEACLAEGVARRREFAWLGVWEKNPRAIAFYRKSGFTDCGEHVFQLGSDAQRDVVMIRPLAAESGQR